MIQVPHSTEFLLILVQIIPRDELGAPADPTSTRVSMAFSPTRQPADDLVFRLVTWQTNDRVVPNKYYAMGPMGSETDAGTLARGTWWPFVRLESNSEIPTMMGEPFRVY